MVLGFSHNYLFKLRHFDFAMFSISTNIAKIK